MGDAFILPCLTPNKNHSTRLVAASSGLIFVLAGSFKLAIPLLLPGASFGRFLSQTGAPMPQIFGVLVPLGEILGGIGLQFRQTRRICALGLIVDMLAAIFLVGAPGKDGRTISVGDFQVGGEAWRLPLEIGLLAALVWLLVARD